LEQYDYLNAQIALRYGPAPAGDDDAAEGNDGEDVGTGEKKRHNKLANTLQCLHPGSGVSDPNAPSIGLYGGIGLQLVPCEDAYYRWSIREDGEGVVVGNGYKTLWAMNAEDTVEGANVNVSVIPSMCCLLARWYDAQCGRGSEELIGTDPRSRPRVGESEVCRCADQIFSLS
jgi:hypothetical protein